MFKFIDTFKAAAGPHWLRTMTVSGTGAYAIATAIEASLQAHGFTFFPTVPKIVFTIAAIVVLLIFWGWKYAHSIRLKEEALIAKTPKLEITFMPLIPYVVDVLVDMGAQPIAPPPPSLLKCIHRYVRLRVVNYEPGTIAHKCQAHISGIQFEEHGAFFEMLGASQLLKWSEHPYGKEGHTPPLDIPFKVNSYIDLFATDEHYNRVFVQWPMRWLVNENIFDKPGVYKLHVIVSSEDGGHAAITLRLEWNGKWNNFSIEKSE